MRIRHSGGRTHWIPSSSTRMVTPLRLPLALRPPPPASAAGTAACPTGSVSWKTTRKSNGSKLLFLHHANVFCLSMLDTSQTRRAEPLAFKLSEA